MHEIESENTPKTHRTNAPAAKQELLPVLKIDSIIWKGKDMRPAKEEYVFDSHGNRTLTLGFYWNYNNAWINSTKDESVYDSNNKLLSTILYYRNSVANTWDYYDKHEYTYDNNNHVILDINSVWDKPTNSWIAKFRYEYTYDSRGNQTSDILSLGTTDDTSVGVTKDERSYDSDNNNISNIHYSWDVYFGT